MSLATGGNSAKAGSGWAGTTHGLSAAEKAANFRKSLDRERAAADPARAVVDATLAGVAQATDPHTIKAFEPMKKPDRQGEWEDRITAMEAKIAAMSYFAHEAQSPYKFVFLAEETGSGSDGGLWKEKTVNGTDIVDFEDGRKSVADGDSGPLLAIKGNCAVLEIPTGSSRAYVKIGGSPIYLVKVLDQVSMGFGFYHSVVVTQKTFDVDPTADLYAVINSILETPVIDPSDILINLMQTETSDAPSLVIGAYYLALKGINNSDGRAVFFTWGHAYFTETISSGCPSVGSNGTSLEFAQLQVSVMNTGSAAACVLDGTGCPPPEDP